MKGKTLLYFYWLWQILLLSWKMSLHSLPQGTASAVSVCSLYLFSHGCRKSWLHRRLLYETRHHTNKTNSTCNVQFHTFLTIWLTDVDYVHCKKIKITLWNENSQYLELRRHGGHQINHQALLKSLDMII